MKSPVLKIVAMKTSHIKQCEAIVNVSEPWKRLNERIDFRAALRNSRTNTRAYVCLAGSRTAGFILFIPEPVFARGGYLRAIGVAPEFRGRGIGRNLLSFAENLTAERALHFFLCVSSFNRGAHRFYQRCGYIKAGNLPGLIRPGVSEYIYWKRLRGLRVRKTNSLEPRRREGRQEKL